MFTFAVLNVVVFTVLGVVGVGVKRVNNTMTSIERHGISKELIWP